MRTVKLLSVRNTSVSRKTAAGDKMAAGGGNGDKVRVRRVEVVGGTRERDEERKGAKQEQEQRATVVEGGGEVAGEGQQVVDGVR